MKKYKSIFSFIPLLFVATGVYAQAPDTVAGIPVNNNELKVNSYVLPDLLTLKNGGKVEDTMTWLNKRRPEVLMLFKENQYGKIPRRAKESELTFEIFDTGTLAFNDQTMRKQVCITFSEQKNSPKMDLLIYLPAHTSKPVPVMLMINFTANSAMVDDPGVRKGNVWNREHQKVPAPEKSFFGTFDVTPFIDKGIGVAMVYYGDIEPDFAEGLHDGVRGLFLKPGENYPGDDEWGAISAWSWGLSCVMDYFEQDNQVDDNKVALFGISRLGKTVLWTGARDPRFAMVIASCSGEGGAALSRRNFGETIAHLTAETRYPYQFCTNYQKFAKNPDKLPVDAHMLIALIAPRPVLLQTGNEDLWSDPKGEYLSARAAEPVYQLFGKEGSWPNQMLPTGEPVLNTVGYYMHDGGHGTIPSDYPVFLEFIIKHLIR